MAEEENNGQAATSTNQKKFTSAERIAELNEIDKSVATLVKSAGSAIQVLANTPTLSAGPTTLDSQKANFAKYSSEYFSTLSSIEVRLRRQIYALEEAGLIPPGDEQDKKRGGRLGGQMNNISGGGPLDASWLNAQASKNVENGMERELWAQARDLVGKYQAQGVIFSGAEDEVRQISKDQAMSVDNPED